MAGAAPPVATMTDDRYVRSRRSRRSLLLHPGLCFEAHRQPDRTWHVQIAGMATATGLVDWDDVEDFIWEMIEPV
jgi:hypothetical protein